MRRRSFITVLGGAAITWPRDTRAQKPAMPVIGFIGSYSLAQWAPHVAGFRHGLSETGYVEGKNVAIEFRWAEGQLDRVPTLVADLVRRQVPVIFTTPWGEAVQAAKAATSTTPIVFTSGRDPVDQDGSSPDRLELPFRPRPAAALRTCREVPVAAIYEWPEHAVGGSLMAYGTDLAGIAPRIAGYVDQILKGGAKPAELPVEPPREFDLVINLKTAKALGITIPQSLLLRADEVIQ